MDTFVNGRSVIGRHTDTFQKELLELMPFLKAFARSLTGNAETADDLAQETLVKAWQSRDDFIPGTNLKAWIFTILRNQFYSDRRRAWRQAPWDQEAAENVVGIDGRNSGHASVELAQTLLRIACLSEEQGPALVAVGYLGMSYEDAAAVLNCAVGTVKSRVARGRKALADLMEEELPHQLDIERFKHATNGIRVDDPYYKIAEAYEDLYARVSSSTARSNFRDKAGYQKPTPPTVPAIAPLVPRTPVLPPLPRTIKPPEVVAADRLWNELLRSGVLNDTRSLDELMHGEQ